MWNTARPNFILHKSLELSLTPLGSKPVSGHEEAAVGEKAGLERPVGSPHW